MSNAESLREYNLTTRDVADQLGVTRKTVSRLVARGEIAAKRSTVLNSALRFRQSDVDEFLENSLVDATDPRFNQFPNLRRGNE